MKRHPRKFAPSLFARKDGNAIVVVLVIGISVAVVVGSVLKHSVVERRINLRHELRLEAKNGAEAMAEYGFAQLRYKFENRTTIASNALDPSSSDALSLPPSSALGSMIDLSKSSVIGGTIPPFPNGLTYIDPSDPNNEYDPLKGKMVKTRKIAIYAKAVVDDPNGGPSITSYVMQNLQVRDAPLFAHAIFYNLDLEISPGPKMDIYGPVHTNGDLYVQGISGLDFHDQVTTAKDILYGWGSDNPDAQGSGHESLQTGDVRFIDRNGDLQTMKISGTYMDSTMGTGTISPDFRAFASDRWNGNLQTQAHGIENYKPVAFPDYAPDDPDTPAYDPINSGHALIEPLIDPSDPDYDSEVEGQKMAKKAGLRIVWDANTDTVTAYKKDGAALDINNLNGSGADKLYEVNDDAMYDDRRKHKIKILDINMGELKQLVELPINASPTDSIGNYDPGSDWNGVVYVETTSSSTDPDMQARLNYSGVRLWGAQTNVVGQGIPSRGSDTGLTIATNDALYIRGNFNAVGVLNQANSPFHSAVVPEVGEVPVSVFGDSVTILSPNWSDSHSLNPNVIADYAHKKGAASDAEVAVAIVSGLIPSDAAGNGRSSGGVHNFPRFLEKWSNRDLFIRGSIVALYESEVDDSPWRIDYYNPPHRKWGFSELFEGGVYPPGTPLLRTYRRVDYTDLSKEEYDTAVAALPW